MATRFLALISPDADAQTQVRQIVLPEGFCQVLDTPRLAVWISADAHWTRCASDDVVVIGDLFPRVTGPRPVVRLTEADGRAITASAGRTLLDDYWGNYVAFIAAPHNCAGGVAVLRDPSGGMPCLHVTAGQLEIIASDVDLLAATGLVTPVVAWAGLTRFLYAFDLRAPATCLSGVSELLAGFRLTVTSSNRVIEEVWSPWDHVRAVDDDPHLAASLAMTVKDCVRGWRHAYSHILLTVSGGLDSSILAACLSEEPGATTYLTLATDDPVGDERSYAHALAHHLGIAIHEAGYRLADVDILRSTAAHLPRPVLYAFGQAEYEARRALARDAGADCLMTGIGGDNVFCSSWSATPVIDRLLAEGPGMGAWRTLNDVCRLTGCSLWDAGAMAARRATHGPAYAWQGDPKFLNAETLQANSTPLTHPWLDAPPSALPGKAAHIAKLVRIQGTIDGFARAGSPPQVHPLLSQPIVEACLRIPTWRWIDGGRNRAVAREAFAAALPEVIINRRSKGGPDSFAYDVVDVHRAEIRERLLDGELMRHQLLDRRALEAALDPGRPIGALDYMRLSGLAEAEAWVRHWQMR